jgi:hypothetical protein
MLSHTASGVGGAAAATQSASTPTSAAVAANPLPAVQFAGLCTTHTDHATGQTTYFRGDMRWVDDMTTEKFEREFLHRRPVLFAAPSDTALGSDGGRRKLVQELLRLTRGTAPQLGTREGAGFNKTWPMCQVTLKDFVGNDAQQGQGDQAGKGEEEEKVRRCVATVGGGDSSGSGGSIINSGGGGGGGGEGGGGGAGDNNGDGAADSKRGRHIDGVGSAGKATLPDNSTDSNTNSAHTARSRLYVFDKSLLLRPALKAFVRRLPVPPFLPRAAALSRLLSAGDNGGADGADETSPAAATLPPSNHLLLAIGFPGSGTTLHRFVVVPRAAAQEAASEGRVTCPR